MRQGDQSDKSNLVILGLILAIIGAGISLYSLKHHIDVKTLGETSAFCNINATFSCDDVAKSEYSEILGFPLGLFGIAYFAGLIFLLVASLNKVEYRKDTMPTYAFMTSIGVLVSIVLFSISYIDIGKLCLSCIGIYFVTILQASITYFLRAEIPSGWSIKGLYNGSFYMLVALIAALAGFQVLEPMPSSSPAFQPDVPKSAEEVKQILQQIKQLPQIKVDRSPYSGKGEDYRKGSDDASIVIVEFADFQCPACRSASAALKRISQEYGDRVQVVFKNYPLDNSCNKNIGGSLHQHACKAAVMARCAGRHGKFWEMHDKIFGEQSKIDETRLELWARDLGLSKDQLAECQESSEIIDKIKDDINQGDQLGVEGTPAVFINGLPSRGRTFDAIKAQVDLLLSE